MVDSSPQRTLTARLACAAVLLLAALLSSCNSDPLTPPPALNFVGEPTGCSAARLFRSSQDGTSYIVVATTNETLELSTVQPVMFEIESNPEEVQLWIDRFSGPPERLAYCSALFPARPQPVRWKAIAGRITIQSTKSSINPVDWMYSITARIDNAVFEGPKGEHIAVPLATIPDVDICATCAWID